MEGWIDCKYCHNRFRAFIQFCPRCGNQNPYYNRHIPGVLKDNIWKRYIVIVVVCILVVITCIVVAFNGFSKSYHSISTNNPDLSNGLYIAKAKPVDLEQRLTKFTTQLIRYALNKINEDRSKFNLPPVQLSYNEAAQIQAADILKARSISHWTTDGMKPYMVYSIYNGSGGVSQNIAVESKYHGTINPYRAIDAVEWDMVYNDSLCCSDVHRQNILYKHHTHVSIGIAYDEDYFTIVQNFENNYINLDEPVIQGRQVQISGQLLLPANNNNINLYGIDIYYDKTPTHLEYENHKYDKSYELGKLVSFVFSPLDFNEWFEYIRNEIYSSIGISLLSYYPIPADKWQVDGKSIDIKFDISPILKSEGVYTVVTYLKDEQENLFPVTSYSIFVKRVG